MTLRRREHAEAAAELDAAIDWYAARRRLVALAFLDAVEASIARIIEWPESGRPYWPDVDRALSLRTTRVKGFPYSIVYLVDGGDLVIFAYPHDRRRPGYWRRRVAR